MVSPGLGCTEETSFNVACYREETEAAKHTKYQGRNALQSRPTRCLAGHPSWRTSWKTSSRTSWRRSTSPSWQVDLLPCQKQLLQGIFFFFFSVSYWNKLFLIISCFWQVLFLKPKNPLTLVEINCLWLSLEVSHLDNCRNVLKKLGILFSYRTKKFYCFSSVKVSFAFALNKLLLCMG